MRTKQSTHNFQRWSIRNSPNRNITFFFLFFDRFGFCSSNFHFSFCLFALYVDTDVRWTEIRIDMTRLPTVDLDSSEQNYKVAHWRVILFSPAHPDELFSGPNVQIRKECRYPLGHSSIKEKDLVYNRRTIAMNLFFETHKKNSTSPYPNRKLCLARRTWRIHCNSRKGSNLFVNDVAFENCCG